MGFHNLTTLLTLQKNKLSDNSSTGLNDV